MSHTVTPSSTNRAKNARRQLDALLRQAGIAPLAETGWIRVTGEDRVRWLNGMVTNSVQTLQTGEGCYNFLLNAQGRIQGDAFVFAEPDALLLETAAARVPEMIALLDRFIIMDDVELADVSSTQTGLLVVGPEAEAMLSLIGLPPAPSQLVLADIKWRSAEVRLLHASSPLVPRFELWADAATIEALTNALAEAGATPCDPQPLDWLRILSGTLRYGTDIRDRDLPQETGQTRALHFAKGCYLGQEIVERIRSRGNVHRTASAFRLEGQLPTPGTHLESESKPVGELTSIATIPFSENEPPIQFALGYIRREALDRKAPLTYPGGQAHPVSTPCAIPPATASNTSGRA